MAVCRGLWQIVAVLWHTVAVCGIRSQLVVVCGGLWQPVAVCASLLQLAAVSCRLWRSFGTPWQSVAGCGGLSQLVAVCGGLGQSLACCDSLWLSLASDGADEALQRGKREGPALVHRRAWVLLRWPIGEASAFSHL